MPGLALIFIKIGPKITKFSSQPPAAGGFAIKLPAPKKIGGLRAKPLAAGGTEVGGRAPSLKIFTVAPTPGPPKQFPHCRFLATHLIITPREFNYSAFSFKLHVIQ